jgi:hypothetical protein
MPRSGTQRQKEPDVLIFDLTLLSLLGMMKLIISKSRSEEKPKNRGIFQFSGGTGYGEITQ